MFQVSRAGHVSVYEVCKSFVNQEDSQADQFDAMLQCVGESNGKSIDAFFLIYASSLVFFMQGKILERLLPVSEK
jgi:hypothetical protein